VDENVFADKHMRMGSSGRVPDVEVDLSTGAPGGLLDDAGLASGPEEFMIWQLLKGFHNIIWDGWDHFCYDVAVPFGVMDSGLCSEDVGGDVGSE
jgi:hypothetical protein